MTVTTPNSTHPTALAPVECTLEIGGMTCASCVGRVHKALHRADGVVTASVNLATETATVTYDPTRVDLGMLTGAVQRAGYTAIPRADKPEP
ncbi:MAG TPA: heavy metal-associated domain-containing protein, partial [Actinoplanes sp.]